MNTYKYITTPRVMFSMFVDLCKNPKDYVSRLFHLKNGELGELVTAGLETRRTRLGGVPGASFPPFFQPQHLQERYKAKFLLN